MQRARLSNPYETIPTMGSNPLLASALHGSERPLVLLIIEQTALQENMNLSSKTMFPKPERLKGEDIQEMLRTLLKPLEMRLHLWLLYVGQVPNTSELRPL